MYSLVTNTYICVETSARVNVNIKKAFVDIVGMVKKRYGQKFEPDPPKVKSVSTRINILANSFFTLKDASGGNKHVPVELFTIFLIARFSSKILLFLICIYSEY